MPKMKTHRGCKERFKITENGKMKRTCAFTNHNAGSKSYKRKKRLQQGGYDVKLNVKAIKKLLLHRRG